MAIGIHVAHTRFIGVDRTGNVIDKNDSSTTIGQVLASAHEHRLIADASIPNTANQPDVDTYLKAEAAIDYVLAHMDQTTIITYKRTASGGFAT